MRTVTFFLSAFIFFLNGFLFSDVYRIDRLGATVIVPTETPGVPLPDSLTIPPDVYTYDGLNYDCTEEGLYRFFTVCKDNHQRIVHHSGVENFLHSISWHSTHGYRDDLLDQEKLESIAKCDRLHLTCGSVSRYADNLLRQYGYKARSVVFLTLNAWNKYSNGHTLLEVKENGVWKLWDVDFRNYFQRESIDLNAKDFHKAVQENDYEIVSYSKSPIFNFGDLVHFSYNFGFFLEGCFLFENRYRECFAHWGGILLIQSGTNFYFTTNDPNIRKRVEGYAHNYTWMDQATWMKTFYSE